MNQNEKARGVYSLVFDVGNSKKTFKIPIFERGEFRYSVDMVTIDHLLFSKDMWAQNNSELRIKLINYVNDIVDYLRVKKNLPKKSPKLLRQCRELVEELSETKSNFNFYIVGKTKEPILYEPNDLVMYFNEIYYFDEQAVTYNKERLRTYIYENEADVLVVLYQIFQSLIYDEEIYSKLNKEKGLHYLMNQINTYKFYHQHGNQENAVGMNDITPMIYNELLNYKNLRLILNQPIILNNSKIREFNNEIKKSSILNLTNMNEQPKDLDELFSVYDLDDIPEDEQRHVDGTGKRM